MELVFTRVMVKLQIDMIFVVCILLPLRRWVLL
jgi:hypothetical protein